MKFCQCCGLKAYVSGIGFYLPNIIEGELVLQEVALLCIVSMLCLLLIMSCALHNPTVPPSNKLVSEFATRLAVTHHAGFNRDRGNPNICSSSKRQPVKSQYRSLPDRHASFLWLQPEVIFVAPA